MELFDILIADLKNMAEKYRPTFPHVSGILYCICGALHSGAFLDLYAVVMDFGRFQHAELLKNKALDEAATGGERQ
jgi:hypothetical protein